VLLFLTKTKNHFLVIEINLKLKQNIRWKTWW